MKDRYVILADGNSPHILKWIRELDKYFELFLISLNGYNQEILNHIDKSRVYVLNESVKSGGGNFKLLFKYFELLKIIKEINPKFINAHYLSSYGFLASFIKQKIPNIQLIQSTWGTDILVTPFESKLKFKIAQIALKNADLVTSDSLYMSDKIQEICTKSNIMTFPFGLDKFNLKEKYDKDEELIFSNRMLSKNYNIDQIVEWFAKLDKKYKLVIAHDGDMKDYLINLSKKLNIAKRVKFVGFLTQQEQIDYYKKAKYYISIPTSDSTSVSLLEAMRYGCYPIVSNLPANREWIIDKINGSFFENSMNLPLFNKDILELNQYIIYKKSIFSKSIEEYKKRMDSL